MFSDILFTTICPPKDLQRFLVSKIILIFCTVLSFDYEKRINSIFEDFIKILLFASLLFSFSILASFYYRLAQQMLYIRTNIV